MVNQKPTLFDWINALLLTVFGLTTLYPFVNMFFISISTMDEVMRTSGLMLWPQNVQWDAYTYVFNYGGLMQAFRITIFITVVGTTLNLIMTAFGAYVVSDKSIPGRNILMTFILVTMFLPGGLIPSYLVNLKLGLVNNVWIMVLPGAISTWNLILMRNFFMSIPPSLKESARIDGCNELRILFQIMLPLSMPIVATLALFYAVGNWNTYSSAIIYITDTALYPLQVAIRRMYELSIMEQMDDLMLPPPVETVRSATVILSTLPILMIYPFVQRYFVKGIIIGSLKG